MPEPTSVLFLKDFRGFTGGHLKAWHYFEYLDSDPRFRPLVTLTRRSTSVENPWTELPESYRVSQRARADILFVDGTEWRYVPHWKRRRPSRPVVNFIQGVRHANPRDERFRYLSYPAIRICTGEEVADAVRRTGRVQGPLLTIPTATDLTPERARVAAPQVDVLVAAAKSPALGRRIAARLDGPDRRVQLQTAFLPRGEFLESLRSTRVAVLLPLKQEGCFLPALEAMAVGAIVVCPDCVGNRSFCLDGVTCFRPAYEEDAVVSAAENALRQLPDLEPMRERAWHIVTTRGREEERLKVIEAFATVEELWSESCSG